MTKVKSSLHMRSYSLDVIVLRELLSVIVLIAMTSSAAFAQTARSTWGNLNQLKAGASVQVTQMNTTVTKGKFISYSQDTISLEVNKQVVEILRDNVRKVDLQKGKGRNIVFGAIAGAALGLAVLAHGSTEGDWAAIFVPVGAGAGIGIGAIFPSAHSVVYERP